MNWQPIGTVPKDERDVLLWCPDGAVVARWCYDTWIDGTIEHGTVFSHWCEIVPPLDEVVTKNA